MYSTIDLLVCLAYLVAVVAVGFFSSRRQHASVSGYFQADHQLPWYAIGFSIVAAGISSEQFVGEMGYAYKLGLPVANWEWLVLPGLSVLLWIFVPLYVRNRIATMPEYLERRFGPRARTLYALLTISQSSLSGTGRKLGTYAQERSGGTTNGHLLCGVRQRTWQSLGNEPRSRPRLRT